MTTQPRPECFGDETERGRSRNGCPARGDAEAESAGSGRYLAEQAALADSALAGDERAARLPVPCAMHGTEQCVELDLASCQDCRRSYARSRPHSRLSPVVSRMRPVGSEGNNLHQHVLCGY